KNLPRRPTSTPFPYTTLFRSGDPATGHLQSTGRQNDGGELVSAPGTRQSTLTGQRAEPVIVEAIRSPVGRGHAEKGALREVHPSDLLGQCYQGVLEKAGVEADQVDNVIAGCANQIAQQSAGIARTAWLTKGLPQETGATTVDIRCGSGQQALHYASSSIIGGTDRMVMAAGVEHMSSTGF